MTAVYPRVGVQYFANRFLVYALRTGVNMDHGSQAFALLAAVALTEDRTRYRKGVKFWNDNLTAYLGCREDRLSKIRARLVKAGWLHYTPGRKGIAGEYWVLVPGGDSKIDDSVLGANIPPGIPGDKSEETADFPPRNREGKAVGKPDSVDLGPNFPPGIRCDNVGDNAGDNALPFFLDLEPLPSGYGTAFEFITKSGEIWNLPTEKLTELRQQFPTVDLTAELTKARQWCLEKPGDRKTARGMGRFLIGWLERATKRGATSKPGRITNGSVWSTITVDLLRSDDRLADWFDAQTKIPTTPENRIWIFALAEHSTDPDGKVANPAALFVSLAKKLAAGKRTPLADAAYDRGKLRLRNWSADQQLRNQRRDDDDSPRELMTAGEIRRRAAT